MEKFFVIALFFFLLSSLLGLGSGRIESKFSVPISKASYLFGGLITAILLIFNLYLGKTFTLSSFFDGVLFTIVVIALGYFIIERFFSLVLTPAFLSALSFFLGILAFFRIGSDSGSPNASILLSGHTYSMFIALAAFTFSFIFSSLFLLQDSLIKNHKIGKWSLKLPPLELTGKLNFSALTVGTCVYFIGILIGIIKFLVLEGSSVTFFEPSTWLSFIMLAFYVAIVSIHLKPLDRSRTLSYVSIVFYFLLIFVFYGAHT